jgi:hypothetical protein
MMGEMEGDNEVLYNEQFNRQYEADMQQYLAEEDQEWMTDPD